MTIYKLTVRYPSGIVVCLHFADQATAHAYYHAAIKPAHRYAPAFIVEPVAVYESVLAAPPEATLQKI